MGTDLTKIAEVVGKKSIDTVASLLGNAMWLGELAGTCVAYGMDLCPEATKDLKIAIEKLLELEIYNKYFVKQFLKELYSTISKIYELSLQATFVPAEMAKIALAGIYDGLGTEELSYNIKELEHRKDTIEDFFQMLSKRTTSLEELLNTKGKQIDKEIQEIETKIESAKNVEHYIQQFKEELKKGKKLQSQCKLAIEQIKLPSELVFSTPPSKEYRAAVNSMLKKLVPYTRKLGSKELDDIIKSLKEGNDVLDKMKRYFEAQEKFYEKRNQACEAGIQKNQDHLDEIKTIGKEKYINELEWQYDKLQMQKDIFKRNISVVLNPISLRPWENTVSGNAMAKIREVAEQAKNNPEKANELKNQQEKLEKELQDSIRKNLSMEKEIIGTELSQAIQSERERENRQTIEQGREHHENLNKLTDEIRTQEGWLQYGRRIIDQQIKDYENAKRSYLEKIQKNDKKMQEEGLSTMIIKNPIKHKAQYKLTARGLLSKDSKQAFKALSYMDNIRASMNAGYLLTTANIYSGSKNTAKYIADKVNHLFLSPQLVHGK